MLRNLFQVARRRPGREAADSACMMNAEGEYTDGARRALRELQSAEQYFNSITDPDLIEYALYEIEAARRKYEYMIRKLRSGEAAYESACLSLRNEAMQ